MRLLRRSPRRRWYLADGAAFCRCSGSSVTGVRIGVKNTKAGARGDPVVFQRCFAGVDA